VPGETDLPIARVEIVPEPNGVAVDTSPLLPKLGSRPATALYTARRYNPFRVAEDRRRLESYLQTLGYLDARVEEPKVAFVLGAEEQQQVVLSFRYAAGPRYALGSLAYKGLPAGVSLGSFERAAVGGSFDLEALRIARYDMATHLQRLGFGHAQVYVRTYLDRTAHVAHVVYLCDAGPRTRVGTIRFEGHKKVAESDLSERLGLAPGTPFDLDAKERAEADLRDTGAFNQVVIETSADVEQYFGDVPDSGGNIPDSRIDDQGNLLPRQLPDTIDLVVHVDEAPRTRIKLRASAELDSTRFDLVAGAGADFLNALGSLKHLTLRGRAGFGVLVQPTAQTPRGLYGDAELRYTQPGLLGRIGDGRAAVRFSDVLYPGFHLRELTAGPGLRSTLARGLFVDLDTFFRLGQQVDFGPFTADERARFALPADDTYRGAEARAALVWDARNDPVEPTDGHFLALRALVSPVGTQRYGQVAPEGRLFVPLGTSFSLATRAAYTLTYEIGSDGVPLGPRTFGGGAFGMRGFGRDRLSPVVFRCAFAPGGTSACDEIFVGGLSLAEASLELRYLPPLRQAGITFFTDVGGAGRRSNAFEDGVSVAAGLGPRLRLWYVPLSVDMSYRFVDRGQLTERGLFVFARIGEAF
jgi:outer membrane translocation and assembly module TamA